MELKHTHLISPRIRRLARFSGRYCPSKCACTEHDQHPGPEWSLSQSETYSLQCTLGVEPLVPGLFASTLLQRAACPFRLNVKRHETHVQRPRSLAHTSKKRLEAMKRLKYGDKLPWASYLIQVLNLHPLKVFPTSRDRGAACTVARRQAGALLTPCCLHHSTVLRALRDRTAKDYTDIDQQDLSSTTLVPARAQPWHGSRASSNMPRLLGDTSCKQSSAACASPTHKTPKLPL